MARDTVVSSLAKLHVTTHVFDHYVLISYARSILDASTLPKKNVHLGSHHVLATWTLQEVSEASQIFHSGSCDVADLLRSGPFVLDTNEHLSSPLPHFRHLYLAVKPVCEREGPELVTNAMVLDNLRSPSAIPPRTSSAGTGTLQPQASKPALKSVAEANWIAQGKKGHPHSGSGGGGGARSHPAPWQMDGEALLQPTSGWSDEKEKILLGPYDYLYGHPGKDIRTLLISAFNAWLKVPRESLEVITKVVAMLHTASLLIDDVEDSSFLRRGIPVAHSIFGVAQTLNSSNYVFFCALRELQKLKNPKAIDIFTEELLNLHRGQGMEIFWRDTLTCPTEEDYLEMVGNKTGGLFRLAVKLMEAESQQHKDCVPLVNLVGLFFQIRDDYMNLFSTQYTQNKGLCEDLTEGKFSFPIIHSIRSNPGNLQLLNILKQRTKDDEVKRYAVTYMESTGSFDYTRKVLGGLMERAKDLVKVVDDGKGEDSEVMAILDKMAVE
ncbi:MAG: geranylgeranyl pyrophosphate synthetase [Piccolia ochrophora]|nr:MAG: geranylgeranyl pyrophosphate synthetase [Piccolia ochrophora]